MHPVLDGKDAETGRLPEPLHPADHVDATAGLRATGVSSLPNPNAALDALAESLGLSLTRISRLWIKLGPAGR